MQVKDVMEREVTTLGLDDHLDIADDIMVIGRIRHLPVVGAQGELVGIVSQRDLLRASVASVLRLGPVAEREWLADIPVRAVMTAELVTVTPDTDLVQAVDRMIAAKIGCLPVVNGSRLVGLLTETDCLRVLRNALGSAEARQLPC